MMGAAVASLVLGWCMAMTRVVSRPLGVLDPVIRVFTGGFELPALSTLERMGNLSHMLPRGPSPLPLFVLAGMLVFLLWTKGPSRTGLGVDSSAARRPGGVPPIGEEGKRR
jgi:hypothetical protein